MKLAICDDVKEVSLHIKNILEKHEFDEELVIDTFTTGESLLESAKQKKYDIILLDIELSKDSEADNGLVVSSKIKASYPEVIIIFFTGRIGLYENELLQFEPFRYIKKPLDKAELIKACEDAIKRIRGWQDRYFKYKISGVTFRINIKEIILFVSNGHYVIIKTIDEDIRIRAKIDDMEQNLRELTDDFVRPNKSYLVNRNYIKIYSANDLVLSNGEEIAVTRKYTKKFVEQMKK